MHQAARFPPFKLPALDVGVLLEAHRKNAAAVTSANQAALDGLRTLAQRQSDVVKATVDDCSRATSDVLAAATLEDKATAQADAARQIYMSTFARFRELSDIMVRANVAAADILNARIAEAFDELRALFAAPAAPAAETRAAPAPVAAAPAAIVEDVAPVVEDAVAPVEAEPAVAAEPVEPEPVVRAAPTSPRKTTKGPRRPTSRG